MNDPNEIHDYLMGRLAPERAEQIEQRILTDDDFHEEVEIMEEEMLDRYAQGRIPEEDRLLFERHFLASPLRKQKLTFALALQTKIDSIKNKPAAFTARLPALYPYTLAACGLALVALGFISYRLSTQLQQHRSQTALLARQIEGMRKTAATAASYPNYPADRARDLAFQPLLVAKLSPGGLRGTGLRRISIPDGVRAVQFALPVPKTVQGNLLVELLNDSGAVITSMHHIERQLLGGQTVAIVPIPTEYMKTGNYFLRVTSEESPTIKFRYPFQVNSGASTQ